MGIEKYVDEFGDEEFIRLNEKYYRQYVGLRVYGYGMRDAFIRTFGHEHLPESAQAIDGRLRGIESSNWFTAEFAIQLKQTKSHDLWNPKESAHQLLSIVRDVYAKDSVRLNAIKELNVLCGITIVDENGKTKAGRSLADFYAESNGKGNKETKPIADGQEISSAETQEDIKQQ